MNHYQVKALKEKPELTKELFLKINDVGLLTGSKVFGGWNKKHSDVDYIFVYEKELCDELLEYSVNATGSVSDDHTFCASYAKYKDFNLNFIIVKDQASFDSWKKAHDMVIEFNEKSSVFADLMKDKLFRVKQFQLIREYYGWISNAFI